MNKFNSLHASNKTGCLVIFSLTALELEGNLVLHFSFFVGERSRNSFEVTFIVQKYYFKLYGVCQRTNLVWFDSIFMVTFYPDVTNAVYSLKVLSIKASFKKTQARQRTQNIIDKDKLELNQSHP